MAEQNNAAYHADIPWLAGLACERLAESGWAPFESRDDAAPSDEMTQHVLDSIAPLPEAQEPRPHIGMHTRR